MAFGMLLRRGINNDDVEQLLGFLLSATARGLRGNEAKSGPVIALQRRLPRLLRHPVCFANGRDVATWLAGATVSLALILLGDSVKQRCHPCMMSRYLMLRRG